MDRDEIDRQEAPMSIVTLVSGGLDSTVVAALAAKAGVRQFPLFVDYGQIAAEQEWKTVSARLEAINLPEPTRMNLSGFGASLPSGLTNTGMDIVKDAFLPGRNSLLLTVGAAYGYSKNANGVAIGLLDEQTALFPDQTHEFIEHIQTAIDVALGDHIEILTPLQSASKDEVLRLADSLGISGTYSCHAGQRDPCGRCISCRERDSAVRRLMER